jgi:chitinase
MPKQGDLRVWWIPQIPGDMFIVDVPDSATATLLLDVLGRYDQFQFDQRIKPDYCNAGGIEEWDEDGNDWLSDDEDEETD